MLSLYGRYIKEYSNTDIYESNEGFFTFRINDDECFVEDLYIAPEYRRDGMGNKFANKIENIAKENGCKYIMCTVCKNASDPNRSSLFIRNNGYIVDKVTDNGIFYKKEI